MANSTNPSIEIFDYNSNIGKTIDDIIEDDSCHICEPMDSENVRQIVGRNINFFKNNLIWEIHYVNI